MKRLIILFLAVIALGSQSNAKNNEFRDHNGHGRFDTEGRFEFFYSSLSPYGEWVDCNYGYAWRPYRVGHTWRPYLNGRWVWTSYGWYWASYEPFGWATFHYGRWSYDDYYGWIWIPDDVWGPSWVEWRYDNDYIGWAPLAPTAVFSFSVGITYSNRWVAPVHYWNFVPCRNFTSTRVIDYVQPVERSRRIYGNTRQSINIRSENNRVVNNGIDVSFVERRGNVRVNRVDVVDNNRGTGDKITRDNDRERIEVYRPRLDSRPGDNQQQRDVWRANPDRTIGDRNDRGAYDRQQPRVPSNEQNERTEQQQRRQRQGMEQGSDPGKRNNARREYWVQPQERKRQETEQRSESNRSGRENWVQPQERGRRSEPNVQRPQREQRSESKQQERSQERSKQQEKQSTRKGRRP